MTLSLLESMFRWLMFIHLEILSEFPRSHRGG